MKDKFSIGVANNEWGCTICIMQHHEDGCITVHYSGVHPEGDSAGVFQIVSNGAETIEVGNETIYAVLWRRLLSQWRNGRL